MADQGVDVPEYLRRQNDAFAERAFDLQWPHIGSKTDGMRGNQGTGKEKLAAE